MSFVAGYFMNIIIVNLINTHNYDERFCVCADENLNILVIFKRVSIIIPLNFFLGCNVFLLILYLIKHYLLLANILILNKY